MDLHRPPMRQTRSPATADAAMPSQNRTGHLSHSADITAMNQRPHNNPCRRLQLIEPGKRVTDPAGRLAIYPQLAGVERFDEATQTFRLNPNLRSYYATPEQIAVRQGLIDRWNAGERFAE